MVSLRAFSPDCAISHTLLTKLPSRISTSLEHAAAILCALRGPPVPVLESGRGR